MKKINLASPECAGVAYLRHWGPLHFEVAYRKDRMGLGIEIVGEFSDPQATHCCYGLNITFLVFAIHMGIAI